jgi:hypothetical protein
MSFEKVIGSLVKESSREPESKYASMSFSDMCAILPHVLPLLSEAEKRAATGDLVKYIPSVGPTIAGGMRGHEDPDTGALAGAARGSIGGSIGAVAGGTLGAAAGLGTAAAGARLANRLGAPIAPQLDGLEEAFRRTHGVGERALARGASANRMRSIALKGIAGGVRKNPVGAAVMAAGLGLPLVGGIAGGLYGQGVGTDAAMPAKRDAALQQLRGAAPKLAHASTEGMRQKISAFVRAGGSL